MSVNYNINEYSTDELLEILNLKPPINKDDINNAIIDINKRNTNNEASMFINKIKNRLINEYDNNNKETYTDILKSDNSKASKVFKNQYQSNEFKLNDDNTLTKKRDVLMAGQNTMLKRRVPVSFTANKTVVQGDNNPYNINLLKRQITFDSQYRRILDNSACFCINEDSMCNDSTKQINMYLDYPTDYTINLNEPLYNVVDLTILNCEIPYSWDVFSHDYGTNNFVIRYTLNDIVNDVEIIINTGNYSNEELIAEINNKITASGDNNIDITFSILNHNKKIKITNNTDDIDYELIWYNIKDDTCTTNNTGSGSKVNYNLGWLLGFRAESITLPKSNNIIALSKLDTNGPSYFYITLDDFNNNKPDSSLISLIDDTIGNFQIPKYYNKELWYDTKGCTTEEMDHIMGDKDPKGCNAIPHNTSRPDNLTKKQHYTAEQLIEARKLGSINRYNSPNTPDILAKIPLIIDNTLVKVFFNPPDTSIFKRQYFGPVTLRKFRIKLITDKGIVVNLNDMDWSFTILVTTLYQY